MGAMSYMAPENDAQRVQALLSYGLLDSPAELDFDELADLEPAYFSGRVAMELQS